MGKKDEFWCVGKKKDEYLCVGKKDEYLCVGNIGRVFVRWEKRRVFMRGEKKGEFLCVGKKGRVFVRGIKCVLVCGEKGLKDGCILNPSHPGKKGESVRQITRTTGAVIKIAAENKEKSEYADSTPQGGGASEPPVPPRDASQTPGEKSVAITATFDAQCRAVAQIFKKLYEERFFGNDPPFLALDLLIPSSQMGKVLGKQKLKIRTIERRTGVNIRVPENKAAAAATTSTTPGDDEKEPPAETEEAKVTKPEDDDSMSYVTIRGTLTQMIQAMTMVKEILHGELPRGGAFMGPPVPPPPPPHIYPPFHRNPFPYPNYRGGRGRARF